MRIPKHVGIIPDGNRRWAVNNNMEKQEGCGCGLAPELTYYGFTVDNCKRPRVQVEAFKRACVEAVELLCKRGAELFVCGNKNSPCFPPELLPYTEKRQKISGSLSLIFL